MLHGASPTMMLITQVLSIANSTFVADTLLEQTSLGEQKKEVLGIFSAKHWTRVANHSFPLPINRQP